MNKAIDDNMSELETVKDIESDEGLLHSTSFLTSSTVDYTPQSLVEESETGDTAVEEDDLDIIVDRYPIAAWKPIVKMAKGERVNLNFLYS